MPDEGDLRTSIKHVGETTSRLRHPSKLSLPQKDIYHLERIQRAATSWVKGRRDLNYEERLKVLKLQSIEKKDKKRFGPDSQDYIQPNGPRINSTVQVPQKARNKNVVN